MKNARSNSELSKEMFQEKYCNTKNIKEYFAFELIAFVWRDLH